MNVQICQNTTTLEGRQKWMKLMGKSKKLQPLANIYSRGKSVTIWFFLLFCFLRKGSEWIVVKAIGQPSATAQTDVQSGCAHVIINADSICYKLTLPHLHTFLFPLKAPVSSIDIICLSSIPISEEIACSQYPPSPSVSVMVSYERLRKRWEVSKCQITSSPLLFTSSQAKYAAEPLVERQQGGLP